jgi:hypothetical protein
LPFIPFLVNYNEDHSVNFFSPSALNVTARECGPRAAQVFTSAWPRTAAPTAPEMMLSLAPIDAAAAERPLIALEHVVPDVRRRIQPPWPSACSS